MLLLQGEPDLVASWAQRGLMPVHVVPLAGWTAVLPAGPSRASPPYDDTVKTFAGRPVPSRLRSAIGLFAVDGIAVITAHLSGWRARQKWFVWSPGEGVVQPRQLVAGRPADLIAASGTHESGARSLVRDILIDGGGDAPGLLSDLLDLLDLPGSDLLNGGQDPLTVRRSMRVEPAEQYIARFERIVAEETRHRAELEED
ncbi:MAG TPA: hypothetical protein VIJ15_15950 [Dermatophilaceae bacterium]